MPVDKKKLSAAWPYLILIQTNSNVCPNITLKKLSSYTEVVYRI